MKDIIKKIDIIAGIYAISGFIFGSLIYYIMEKSNFSEDNKGYLLLVIIIFFTTNLYLLNIEKQDNKIKIINLFPALISAIVLSVFYYFTVKINIENYPGNMYASNDYDSYLGFSLVFIYIILILYIKSFISSDLKKLNSIFSYDNLLNILLEYNIKNSSAFLMLGGIWIILILWSLLFKLIDINFFYNALFDNTYFPFVLSTSIFFGVYGIVNNIKIEFKKFILKLSALQFFLEFISAFLILFIIFLPIMGPKKIFNTGYSSAIMLTLNGIGLILIQFINFENKNISKLRKYLITSFIVLEPVFSFLALYSIMVRINQYAFSPQRVIALVVILIFNMLNLSYLYGVIKGKLLWRIYIKKYTPYLIAITAFILFLTITPILNPYEISVKSQISAFGNNMEKLDLATLKFKLSAPGKQAFEKLKVKFKNNKKAMEQINKIDKCKSYRECRNNNINNINSENSHIIKQPEIVLNIFPETEKEPENFRKLLDKTYENSYNYRNANFIIKDFLPDYKGKEIVLVKNVYLLSEYRNYMAVFVKNENNQYKLLKETILPKNAVINLNNFKLLVDTNYTTTIKGE